MAFEGLAELVQQARNQNYQNKQNEFNQSAQFGGQLGGSIGDMMAQYKQKQLLQQLIQKMQNQGAPQQGPQMPGMGAMPPGQAGPPQQPMSGMGAPPADNTQQMKALMMQLDPQGMMQNMETQMFQPGMNPLQQSEIDRNRALAERSRMGPQQKPVNPLDDAKKARQIALLDAVLKNFGKPKPINPVGAANVDVNVQKANLSNAPWYQRYNPFTKTPKIVNPLKGQSSSNDSDMQEIMELYRLAGEGGDDNQ